MNSNEIEFFFFFLWIGFVEKLNVIFNFLVYFIFLGRIMKRRVKGIFIIN